MKHSFTRQQFNIPILLLALAVLFGSIPLFSVSADAYETVDRTVYVSENGSDSGKGTKASPYATVTRALTALCGGASSKNGGTIVLMDSTSQNVENGTFALNNGILKQYAHNNLLVITGKDPYDGTVYPAKLYYDNFGLVGPTKFEHVMLYPSRSSLYINTCGKPLVLGDDVSAARYQLLIHDGIGEAKRGTVDSTDTVVDGAVVTRIYVGGGYAINTSYGVMGNSSLTIKSGVLSEAVIGFDSYSASHTDAQIRGNVTVTVEGDGVLSKISIRHLPNDTIGGAFSLILNGGKKTAVESLPQAAKGVYVLYSGLHGKAEATDTEGSFRITADKGYLPVINGTQQESGVYAFPQGESTIQYVRGGSSGVSLKAYAVGSADGNFYPDAPITRAEGITMMAATLADKETVSDGTAYADVTEYDWFYDALCYFEKYGLLPNSFETDFEPTRRLTRGEFLYMAEALYIHGTGSYKLADFSDVSEKHPFYRAIMTAYNEGKINGYDDGTFRPDAEITRAEAVAVLNRYTERKPLKSTERFPDVPLTHWANKQIAAASEPLESGYWEQSMLGTEYILPSSGRTDEAVKSLYNQSRYLSADAIRDGIDTVSEQMKKNILNTTDSVTVTGTKYYVSEKNGNDQNDGKSTARPLKTLSAVGALKLKAGDGVFFERGGIYRGSIGMTSGVTYAAYGSGNKPLLMQSKKNYADPALWVETEYPNVYRCTDLLANVGIIGFDHDLFDYSENSYHELYGDIMNLNTLGFKGVADLKADLQFYSDISGGIATAGPLYVYSTKGNPGSRFSSIEIGERVNIFRNSVKNVTIDNLAFKFTGAHAVGMGTSSNVTIQNCVFSWLGGSVLSVSANGAAVNYGNAVEIYGGCDGYRVENCWMYQIYDTAVTHQRSSDTGNCIQTGVRYLSNLMEYVHWGIEFYNAPPTEEQLNGAQDTYTRYTGDVYDAYNVLRMGGYGWGSVTRFRQNSARLYCGSTLSDNGDELTEYNIFDRCAGYLLNLPSNAAEVDDKNIYVQTLGKTLGSLKGVYRVCTNESHRYIRDYFGDQNAVVIVTEE